MTAFGNNAADELLNDDAELDPAEAMLLDGLFAKHGDNVAAALEEYATFNQTAAERFGVPAEPELPEELATLYQTSPHLASDEAFQWHLQSTGDVRAALESYSDQVDGYEAATKERQLEVTKPASIEDALTVSYNTGLLGRRKPVYEHTPDARRDPMDAAIGSFLEDQSAKRAWKAIGHDQLTDELVNGDADGE